MKPYFIFLTHIAIFIGAGTVFGESVSDDSMMACTNPSCDRLAETVSYIKDKPKHSITLKTSHFSIEVPDKSIEKISYSNDDIIIQYKDNEILYVSESKEPDIKNLNPDLIIRYPEIVFLKTTKNVMPEEDSESLLWKIALASKQFYFSDSSEVIYAQNNPLAYYITNSAALGFSGRAMVTNTKFKDRYLVIDAKQMNFNTFKKIVLSIE